MLLICTEPVQTSQSAFVSFRYKFCTKKAHSCCYGLARDYVGLVFCGIYFFDFGPGLRFAFLNFSTSEIGISQRPNGFLASITPRRQ